MVFIVGCVFIACAVSTVSANDSHITSSIVADTVYKLCNISMSALLNATSEERSKLLDDIEEKLKTTDLSLGVEGKKYAKLIMHSLKFVAFNETSHLQAKHGSAEIVPRSLDNKSEDRLKVIERKNKEQAMKNIAKKLKRLAEKLLKENKVANNTKYITEHLKERIRQLILKKDKISHKITNDPDRYTNIITGGLDEIIEKQKIEKHAHKQVGIHRKFNQQSPDLVTGSYSHGLQRKCGNITGYTCSSIKSLKEFVCHYDKHKLPLEKLCDGIIDCLDMSDERKCAEQAIDRIQRSMRLMKNIESTLSSPFLLKCFPTDLAKSILTSQNQVLRNVLHSQLVFLHNYTDVINKPDKHGEVTEETVKKLANKVALVVSSLAMALDGSFCARRVGLNNIDAIAAKLNDVDEPLNNLLKDVSWNPKSCSCNGLFCQDSNCMDTCRRVCWQKYCIDRWSCPALDGNPSISLDLICDGKFDCFDETDENGCYLGNDHAKFIAGNKYNDVLKAVSSSARSEKYRFILPELLSLYESVKLLQKLSFKEHTELMNIKIVRNECYSIIRTLYEKVLPVVNDVDQLNKAYDFFTSVSKTLIEAMKKSQTGNEKIITTNGCFCTGTRCTLPQCSKSCIKVCAAEPVLTRYGCKSENTKNSVPIEKLCNNKNDCFNGEDEANCQKEICRGHHLVLIRNSIQDVGKRQRGTSLGEVLMAWSTKATNTLMIEEKNGRPTKILIKDIVQRMLRDLTESYSMLDEPKRNTNNETIKQFVKISQKVIESLKLCT